MALLKIENAEVTRHVGTRGAFAIAEHVTLPDGRTFPKTYTVWAEGDAPNIGDIVSVTGIFSAKVREYPAKNPSGGFAAPITKHAVDISINEPQVTVLGAAPTPPPAAPIEEPAPVSNELPF